MKSLVLSSFVIVLTVYSVFTQAKGGSPAMGGKSGATTPAAKTSTNPVSRPNTEVSKPREVRNNRVEPMKKVEPPRPVRDTVKAREAAKIGIRRHQEIQSKLGNQNKSRVSEVRMSEMKSKRGFRPDIVSKNGRPFEIKPQTVSGYRKGHEQLKRQENALAKRGALILYEPKTGKYRIERTPYREWRNRQRPREMRFRPRR